MKHVWMAGVMAGALLAAPVQAQTLGERILRGGVIAAQGLFVTPAAEVQLGRQTAAKVLAQMPQVQDPTLTAYVRAVGQRVAAHAERRDIPYTFYAVAAKEVNAFSLAGGYVFITTACLNAMQNEAQLAGVLGHEVGHVVHKDQVREIRRTLLAQGVAAGVLGDSAGVLQQAAVNVGATLVLRGYGRSAEYAADLTGARYASQAGYDPRQLEAFLGTLARLAGNQPTWLLPLADHPRSDDRIRKLDAYIASQRLAGGNVAAASFTNTVRPALARMGGGAGR